MTRLVAVVDHGMGNLRSVSQALMHVAAGSDCRVVVTSRPDEVLAAERVVLPGQGAMRDCMRELEHSGLQAAVLAAARNRPLLGVCVGMQMLLDHSEEQDTPGLGLVPGRVVKFRLEGRRQSDGSHFKLPQMGWNQVPPAGARRIRCGATCPTTAGSTFCTATTPNRRTNATVRRTPTTAAALPVPWRGITFLPRSSTPRRAPPTV